MLDQKGYWAIYRRVQELTGLDNLETTDRFISNVVCRVEETADDEWNDDDVRISIRNELNDLIQKFETES